MIIVVNMARGSLGESDCLCLHFDLSTSTIFGLSEAGGSVISSQIGAVDIGGLVISHKIVAVVLHQ